MADEITTFVVPKGTVAWPLTITSEELGAEIGVAPIAEAMAEAIAEADDSAGD